VGALHRHPLDHPVWSSLTTRQAHLAIGHGAVRRYLPAISPITAVSESGGDVLSSLIAVTDIGDDVSIFGPITPALGRDWAVLREARITQMIREDTASLPESNIEASVLDAADVEDMMTLVELTQPGPFRTRTIELGTFMGVRENGRLIAMAGERMWTGDLREVSGICTHPEARGRGYARALTARVVNRMLRAGQTPFLHVYSINHAAIDLYRALGFVQRAEFPLLHARRVG